MDYNEWIEKLFEETYPKHEFYQGEIQWNDHETIILFWDNRKYVLNIDEFYNSKDLSPVDKIIQWAYSTMPFTEEEKSEARTYWDGLQFRALVQRPENIAYSQSVSEPSHFAHHGDTEGFTWDIRGSMLIIKSFLKNVPATSAISEIEALYSIIEDYYDVDDRISVVISYDEPSKIVIGNKNAIERIQDEDHQIHVIGLLEWIDQINGETTHG